MDDARDATRLTRARRSFARWRHTRPFWGGLCTVLAAGELLLPTMAPIEVRFVQGIAGVGTMVLSLVLLAMAVISWSHPHLRPITGVMIVIAGLTSFAVSNLGGYFLGLILAVVGGALIFAWRPPVARDGVNDVAGGAESASGGETQGDAEWPSSDDTGHASSVDGRSSFRAHRAGGAPRVRCRLLVVSLVCLTLSATLISFPGDANATSSDPLPWPTWLPTGDPSSPDEPEESEPPDDPDEPDTPGEDPPDTTDKCRPDDLPDTAPELGSEAASKAARNLAACLKADSGEARPQSRDVPVTSTPSPVTEARVMTMEGLDYEGVASVPTADGKAEALEFTMDTLSNQDMDQAAEVDDSDAKLHVINMDGAATLSGDVRLYVRRIEGKIFGTVPVTLTPDNPPPLIVPNLVLTDVTTETAYIRSDTVELPKLEEPTR